LKCSKILSHVNEHDNNPNIHEIAFQIFKKLVDTGLDENFIWLVLKKFAIKWKNYLLALQCIV
jgi:hypothetical protein